LKEKRNVWEWKEDERLEYTMRFANKILKKEIRGNIVQCERNLGGTWCNV